MGFPVYLVLADRPFLGGLVLPGHPLVISFHSDEKGFHEIRVVDEDFEQGSRHDSDVRLIIPERDSGQITDRVTPLMEEVLSLVRRRIRFTEPNALLTLLAKTGALNPLSRDDIDRRDRPQGAQELQGLGHLVCLAGQILHQVRVGAQASQ